MPNEEMNEESEMMECVQKKIYTGIPVLGNAGYIFYRVLFSPDGCTIED